MITFESMFAFTVVELFSQSESELYLVGKSSQLVRTMKDMYNYTVRTETVIFVPNK